jgi:methionyl-tRNA synthetase
VSSSASNPIPEAFQTISIETGSPVEWSEELNYMFRLSSFRDHLLHYYRSHPRSIYPQQYREDILKMLSEGEGGSSTLADISISRPRSRLEWGIQVPDDSSQTVYVWFDALLIYLTGSGYPWSSATNMGCWPADLQIIGKDILRFHAIYLPAILQALSSPPYPTKDRSSQHGIPFSRTILAHAHWTSSQKKMSKSLGNVADPLEAIEKWGVDIVRFYLMRVGGRWKDDIGGTFNRNSPTFTIMGHFQTGALLSLTITVERSKRS